jgi:hypothetical protein
VVGGEKLGSDRHEHSSWDDMLDVGQHSVGEVMDEHTMSPAYTVLRVTKIT